MMDLEQEALQAALDELQEAALVLAQLDWQDHVPYQIGVAIEGVVAASNRVSGHRIVLKERAYDEARARQQRLNASLKPKETPDAQF
jgi:hypothetical protein